MSTKHRVRAFVAAIAAAGSAVVSLIVAAPTAQAVTGHPPGLIGSPVKLGGQQQMQVLGHPYDVATTPSGTAYIAWVSSTVSNSAIKVRLCKLGVGATSCSGGVQTIDALSTTGAGDIHVVVTGDDVAHLIWMHDAASGRAIAEATALHGQNLTAGHDVASVSSAVASLLTVARGPGGSIWTVTYDGLPAQHVEVRAGLAASPVTVNTPYIVGYATLAFAGSTAVLSVDKYSFNSTAPHYVVKPSSGAWGGFHAVPNTSSWGGDTILTTTRRGMRIVTGVDNASYRPVIAKWSGSGFTPRQLTADSNSCAPSSHDGWADASGRLLDASWECGKVTVANYADAFHAAIARFSVSNTATYAPEIASGTRGIATVVYSVEDSGGGNIIRAAHVRLPDSTYTVAHSGTAGRVTVTGPRSCLPPSNVHIGWTHRAASGWTFKSGALRLNGNVVSGPTLDGAKLTAGKQYSLTGTAVFARNGNHNTVKATLTFTSCAQG